MSEQGDNEGRAEQSDAPASGKSAERGQWTNTAAIAGAAIGSAALAAAFLYATRRKAPARKPIHDSENPPESD